MLNLALPQPVVFPPQSQWKRRIRDTAAAPPRNTDSRTSIAAPRICEDKSTNGIVKVGPLQKPGILLNRTRLLMRVLGVGHTAGQMPKTR